MFDLAIEFMGDDGEQVRNYVPDKNDLRLWFLKKEREEDKYLGRR